MNPRDSLQNNLPMFDKNVNVIKDEERLDFKKTEKKKRLKDVTSKCNTLSWTGSGNRKKCFLLLVRALLGLLAHFEKDLQIR